VKRPDVRYHSDINDAARSFATKFPLWQLPEPVFARTAAEIRDAHCGHASETTVKAMVHVQRARDAQMGQSLLAAGDRGGAILVSGAGHVRNDYGIPVYLRSKAPEKRVISIAFVEVDKQKTEPQSYALSYPNTRLPFDFVGSPTRRRRRRLRKVQVPVPSTEKSRVSASHTPDAISPFPQRTAFSGIVSFVATVSCRNASLQADPSLWPA
jgi:hypothetical protein